MQSELPVEFLVKDNIATKDKMETTAGSWMLVGSIVPRDAHVVSKLRNAGALLMGHATLSEWADMRSNNVWVSQCGCLRRTLTRRIVLRRLLGARRSSSQPV
jgi:Amidase